MGNIAFLIAFIVIPIIALWRLKSVTWTLVVTFLSVGFVGAFVQVSAAFGTRWTMVGLQWALTAAMLVVLVVAVVGSNPRPVPWRIQVSSLLVPSAVVLGFLVVSRVLAPAAGPFADVCYFVLNRGAEDNADWLDFTGRLASGGPVDQITILGGPLQLLLVFAATLAATLSLLAFGGINQVLIAADSVLYAQFFLAALAPMAVAPVAERAFASRWSDKRKTVVSPVAVWSGALVLSVMSIAAMGFGHLSVQFTFITVTLWFGAFWITFPMPRIRVVTTAILALTSLVWFPLAPVAFIALAAYGAKLLVDLLQRRRIDWVSVILWATTVVLVAQPMRRALMYIFLTTSTALPTSLLGGGFGRSVVSAMRAPALILLESQGGTEIVGPILGVMSAAAVLGGGRGIARLSKSSWLDPLRAGRSHGTSVGIRNCDRHLRHLVRRQWPQLRSRQNHHAHHGCRARGDIAGGISASLSMVSASERAASGDLASHRRCICRRDLPLGRRRSSPPRNDSGRS